jgi:CheY-like chemotaxis protein
MLSFRMKCPRCQTAVSGAPDPGSVVLCPGCGARLRTKTATVPPPPPPPPAPAVTPPPPPEPAAAAPAAKVPSEGGDAPTLRQIAEELRTIRQQQDRILQILELLPGRRPAATPPLESPAPPAAAGAPHEGDGIVAEPPAPTRARRRKTVLLMDDDPTSREIALRALEAAEVPTRAVSDGASGIAALMAEKPDVLVIEPELGGVKTGRDVIDLVKATMEWVNIPVVIYTRANLPGVEEARLLYGADELVLKGERGGEALVSHVIAIFRRR